MYYTDVVPDYVIKECVEHYNSIYSYRSNGKMNKSDASIHIDTITKLVESILGKRIKFRGGNFYKHTEPYLPHTDWKSHLQNNLNVVIPLEVDCDVSLVVFDQLWKYNSVTWCMNEPVIPFRINTGVKGYPYEYPIEGRTGKNIDDEFWRKYLSMYPKEGLFDMSGEALNFTPKSIMIFDNQRIHGTSSFNGTKLGLTLRYEV